MLEGYVGFQACVRIYRPCCVSYWQCVVCVVPGTWLARHVWHGCVSKLSTTGRSCCTPQPLQLVLATR